MRDYYPALLTISVQLFCIICLLAAILVKL